ncbi:TraR/DksA family transcriptional regulator [Nocardia sp. R7R-8]|uniref:TraR/DksA family transcriptional regulator n=1 Tax=Nocardia sp. R7R-8 TaxID=3459304 RepID=UPI00403E0215
MPIAHPDSPARLSDHIPALRARLNQQRRFRLQQLAELDADIDRTPTPVDAAAEARQEVTITLAAAARHALADIDEALTLIGAGRYGRCRGCHAEIPIHILRTIPTTQWCLHCLRHLPAFDGSRPMRGQLPRATSHTPRDPSTRRKPLARR